MGFELQWPDGLDDDDDVLAAISTRLAPQLRPTDQLVLNLLGLQQQCRDGAHDAELAASLDGRTDGGVFFLRIAELEVECVAILDPLKSSGVPDVFLYMVRPSGA